MNRPRFYGKIKAKTRIFYPVCMSDMFLNVETLLARVWGWGKTFSPAPDAGKQRLYIQEEGVKAVLPGYPKIRDNSFPS